MLDDLAHLNDNYFHCGFSNPVDCPLSGKQASVADFYSVTVVCLSVIRVALALVSLWWRPGPLPLQRTTSFMWLSSLWISSSTASHPKPATHNFTFWYGFLSPETLVHSAKLFFPPPQNFIILVPSLITILEGLASVPYTWKICKPEL